MRHHELAAPAAEHTPSADVSSLAIYSIYPPGATGNAPQKALDGATRFINSFALIQR